MNQSDFVQNKTTKQKTSALVWMIASIMLHVLILLMIMTYKFNMFETEISKTIHPDDQVTLWTNQPQIRPQPQATPTKQELKPEEKKDPEPESKQESSKKMPIIIAGKQGINEQNLEGTQGLEQSQDKTTEQLKAIPLPEPKQITQQQPIQQNKPLYKTTPLKFCKGNLFLASTPQQAKELSPLEQSLEDQESSFKEMYKHIPKQTKEIPVKTISFKDLGLGENNSISTFGNSAHMGIQGDSPDIPTGEELKYITYLNQMANMIVSSMRANPQRKLIHRTYEQVIFHVKVDRAGNLLATKIINPSKNQIINIFILESVKQVGLFNPLPIFIKKDTFEINWRINM